MAWPYTGRRVSSLVPWGGSGEPETVEVSQDDVNRRGEGDWEGEGDGAGEGEGEGEGGEREGEAREEAREREQTGKEKELKKKEKGGTMKRKKVKMKSEKRKRWGKDDKEGYDMWTAMIPGASPPTLALGRQTSNCHVGHD